MIVKLVRVSEGNVFDGVIAVTWLDCVVTADVHGGCAWRMCMANVHGQESHCYQAFCGFAVTCQHTSLTRMPIKRRVFQRQVFQRQGVSETGVPKTVYVEINASRAMYVKINSLRDTSDRRTQY